MKPISRTSFTYRRVLAGAVLIAGFSAVPVSHACNYGGNCVPYQLKTYGGEGGIRTLNNPDNFRRTNGGHISGQFCGSGRLKVELSKRDPHTFVSLLISGSEYTFGAGDRGDRQANHWYRRYFHIDLPQYSQRYGYNDGHQDSAANKHYKKNKKSKKSKKHRKHQRRNEHYDQSYGYQNKHYGNGYGYNQGYQQNGYHQKHRPKAHKPKHSHGHGIGPKPRLRIDSKIHRKAHKLHLPHQHKREKYAYQ